MDAFIGYERIEVRLNDGTIVLGKDTEYGHAAKTYSNRTQAAKAAEREAGVVIQRGRPFYVKLKGSADRDIAERARIDAEHYDSVRNKGSITLPRPTVVVFVEGGLVQDVCFAGDVRVIVIDFDEQNDDPTDDKLADYTTPDGNSIRVGLGIWERSTTGANWASDESTVREALKAAGEEG